MNAQAFGLNETGDVSRGSQANQMEVQGTRGKSGQGINGMGDLIQGTDRGPASMAQLAGKRNQASAQFAAANHSGEYNVKKVMAEKSIVQTHEESAQIQAPNASQAEATFSSLNRPL